MGKSVQKSMKKATMYSWFTSSPYKPLNGWYAKWREDKYRIWASTLILTEKHDIDDSAYMKMSKLSKLLETFFFENVVVSFCLPFGPFYTIYFHRI